MEYYYSEPYIYFSAPSILLSIVTITLNIFVIKFYWKRELTVVPLLYTLIASLDILTAIGIIHIYVVFLLYKKECIGEWTANVNVMILCFFIQISYRCSVFSNLLLAVSRTIMILRPFYQINIKAAILTSILYSVPWMVFYGINVHQFHGDYTEMMALEGYLIGTGLAYYTRSADAYYMVAAMPDIVAFLIPVIIVIATCLIQIRSLHRSSQFPTSSNQRHVTTTVLLMSTIFVLCNSPFSFFFTVDLIFYLTGYFESWYRLAYDGQRFYFITALSATLLPILNASLNPVIIITRSSGMRRTFSDSLQRMLRLVRARPD